MPQQKGNKTVLTEAEAKKIMESMQNGNNAQGQANNKLQNGNNNQSNNNQPNGGQGKGWWNDPIRHALASYGVQTAMDNSKTAYDDMGSVYLPSDRLKGSLKDKLNDIESERLKQIINQHYIENPERANEFDDEIENWLENNIGSIKHKSQSQKERNQTINGNIQLTESEYETLEEFHKGLNSDYKTLEMWINNIESKFEKEKNEAKNELQEFVQKQRNQSKNEKEFRMKVMNKINEKVVDLNVVRADLKYAKGIKDVIGQKKDDVQNLYQNSVKQTET